MGFNGPVRASLKPQIIPSMKTKSVLSLCAALGCLTLAAASLSAQSTSASTSASDSAGSGNGARGRGRGAGPGTAATPDAQVQRLNAAVTLTDAQKARVLAIYQDEATQLQAVRDDTKLTQEARMAKQQEIQAATRTAVRALLTADQQKKFDAMPAGGRGNRGGPGGGGPGGGGQGGGGGRGRGGRGGGGGGGAAN
jgi:Spy/CpxP family protein refolding chaperone